MIDASTQTLLQDIVRRESRSLLQYVSDSFPWTTLGEREALAQFQNLVQEQRQGVSRLVQLLARREHTFPQLGSYPMAFTDINYVSLEHLLPLLAKAERRSLIELKHNRPQIRDTEAQEVVDQLVAMKGRHADSLEAMAAAYPEKYSTIRGQAS